MQFLIISQRAKGNPDFSLKDLPGHGRFDIIPRTILAAIRPLAEGAEESKIVCYLKGSEPWGWLEIPTNDADWLFEDEISVAHRIKVNWERYWKQGGLSTLIDQLSYSKVLELSEGGEDIEEIDLEKLEDALFILGAQYDITDEDRAQLPPVDTYLRIGNAPLLASEAIMLVREIIHLRRKEG